MKFTILIGALALTATAFTPLAHASAAFGGLDKQCFKVLRKEWTSCNNGAGSNAKLPDFKLDMKSTKSRNNNTNVGGGTNNNEPDTGGEDPGTGPDTDSNTGNEDTGSEPDTGGEDPGIGPDTDTDNSSQPDNNTGGGNNTSPPQSNSNDIKGFDPSTGLYGPGT
jgi:hypothetical protein